MDYQLIQIMRDQIPFLLHRQRVLSKEIILIIFIGLIIMVVPSSSKAVDKNLCENIIEQAKKGSQSRLDQLLKVLETRPSQPCTLELIPKYYWAQNMSHIMVKFEFLNSADTSACDRVLSTQKHIEHNVFSLSLICLQSSLVIRYKISVTTFMPMNYYHAVWKTAEQNTIILECMKSPNPYFWKNLYTDKQTPLRKPKIWWKLMEKYKDHLKEFIYDLQVQEGEDDISGYVRRKRSIKLPQDSMQDPNSNIYFYCNQNNPFELGSWLS